MPTVGPWNCKTCWMSVWCMNSWTSRLKPRRPPRNVNSLIIAVARLNQGRQSTLVYLSATICYCRVPTLKFPPPTKCRQQQFWHELPSIGANRVYAGTLWDTLEGTSSWIYNRCTWLQLKLYMVVGQWSSTDPGELLATKDRTQQRPATSTKENNFLMQSRLKSCSTTPKDHYNNMFNDKQEPTHIVLHIDHAILQVHYSILQDATSTATSSLIQPSCQLWRWLCTNGCGQHQQGK